jgi:hypothetical protein
MKELKCFSAFIQTKMDLLNHFIIYMNQLKVD